MPSACLHVIPLPSSNQRRGKPAIDAALKSNTLSTLPKLSIAVLEHIKA
jgi:hypothetical protein